MKGFSGRVGKLTREQQLVAARDLLLGPAARAQLASRKTNEDIDHIEDTLNIMNMLEARKAPL